MIICTLAALGLSSCGTTYVKPVDGAYTSKEERIQQARKYIRQADKLKSPQKETILLAAADIFNETARKPQALKTIEKIDPRHLDAPRFNRYSLLYAELALGKNDFLLAKSLLKSKQFTKNIKDLTVNQQHQRHALNGRLYQMLGNQHKSVFSYTRAAKLTKNQWQIAKYHDSIWHVLSSLHLAQLQKNSTESSNATIIGWYQLAMTARQSQGDISAQIEAISGWKDSHSTHPAAQLLPTRLQAVLSVDRSIPRKIALLLPRSERYRLASNTVTQGILASYYESFGNGSSVPEIIALDTDSDHIISLYKQAISRGADLVIGPLRKDKLTQLLSANELAIPVLGLNFIEGSNNRHDNLFQFGLAIQDEALEAAAQAWRSGNRRILTITPETSWGNNALDSFSEAWQAEGGEISGSIRYKNNQQDYAPLLEPVFLLKQSRQRAQRLTKTLGKKVAFNATRRRDVDAIFLVANPQTGRQIKPTLDFLYAADLPVYATSLIYDGHVNRAHNRDLDGILFPAMPWTVNAPGIGNVRPNNDLRGSYRNLFALGADAYSLHQWLATLKAMNHTEIPALTGNLSLSSNNQITRTLPWATFKKGSAKPISLPSSTKRFPSQ